MALDTLGLDAGYVERLDRISMVARRRATGTSAGPRRSRATGSSVEFADFRTYAAGDDFRRVDWNAYARLERLFLRVYEAEENTTVTIFIDCSESMRFGDPSKALVAKRLAASLAYIALVNYDRVAVAALGDRLVSYLPPRAGRARAPEVWRFIADLPVAGVASFDALAHFAAYRPGSGLTFILSDMFTEQDWRRSMRVLRASCNQEITVLQILSADEVNPTQTGDRTLIDCETGAQTEISESGATLAQYRTAFNAYTQELGESCRVASISFAQLVNTVSLDDTVMRMLTRLGVVR